MSLRTLGGRRRALPRAALEVASPDAARVLLGKLLVRREDDGSETVVRLVETEAYREDDPASHSYRGRTPRVEAMFGPPGRLYVYFTYGMHWCCNVSCEVDGTGAAVLLRAGLLLSGHDYVRRRRGERVRDRDLLRGPARLAQGLGVDRVWYGVDLLDGSSPLRLEDDGWEPPAHTLRAGPRVGVRAAADRPWRVWVEGLPEVSRYTRHPRAD